jgi:hypothetical protein
MAAGQYRALDNVHSGQGPVIKPGEIVPGGYTDSLGVEQTVDFDRLLELGAVQDASLPYAPEGAEDPAAAPGDAPEEDLARLKVAELKAIATTEGVPGADGLKKAELVAAIEAARSAS